MFSLTNFTRFRQCLSDRRLHEIHTLWIKIIHDQGHTDAIGSDQYNLKLSEMRAFSVRDYLLQAGIESTRIVAVRGFGKTRPVTTNDTSEGRQMNRRVELIIADEMSGQQ